VRVTARYLVIAVTVCSWLAISNHCAIGALTTRVKPAESSCPFHSKPAKPQSNQAECCKSLRALAKTPAKLPTRSIVDLPGTHTLQLPTFAPLIVHLTPRALDTGPPGKTSFSDFNRSMRPHAPPFLA